jgi:hypothetical protein
MFAYDEHVLYHKVSPDSAQKIPAVFSSLVQGKGVAILISSKMYTFTCGEEKREVLAKTITQIPMLQQLVTDIPNEESYIVEELSPEAFDTLIALMEKKKVPHPSMIIACDFAGIGVRDNYQLAMSCQTYRSFDSYHGLEKLTEELWNSSNFYHPEMEDVLSYGDGMKSNWQTVQSNVLQFQQFLVSPHLLIAGQAVFNCLTESKVSTVNCYFHSCTTIEAGSILTKLTSTLGKNVKIIREVNRIHYELNDYTLYVYHNIYSSHSALLLDQSVDSNSIGYDGSTIWISHRALYALHHRYNTINLEFLSSNYGAELLNAAETGMDIRIPGFKCEYLDEKELSHYGVDYYYLAENANFHRLLMAHRKQCALTKTGIHATVIDVLAKKINYGSESENLVVITKLVKLLCHYYVALHCPNKDSIKLAIDVWMEVSTVINSLLHLDEQTTDGPAGNADGTIDSENEEEIIVKHTFYDDLLTGILTSDGDIIGYDCAASLTIPSTLLDILQFCGNLTYNLRGEIVWTVSDRCKNDVDKAWWLKTKCYTRVDLLMLTTTLE